MAVKSKPTQAELSKFVKDAGRLIKEIQKRGSQLTGDLKKIEKDFVLKTVDTIPSGEKIGSNKTKIRRSIRKIFDDIKYDKRTEKLMTDVAEWTRDKIVKFYEDQGLEIKDYQVNRIIDQFKSLMGQKKDAVSTAMWNNIFSISRGTGVLVPSQIIKQAEKSFSRNVTNTGHTLMQGSYRASSNAMADANGFEEFVYTGVLDDKTREFCRKHIGEVKTLEEWDKLDNGQLNPVSVYCGGYNCRHFLMVAIYQVTKKGYRRAFRAGLPRDTGTGSS